jgi:hypothetical protein
LICYLFFFLGNIHSSLLEIDVNKENVFDEAKTKWPTGFWTQYKNLTLRSVKLSAGLAWLGFDLTMLEMIGTDCTCSLNPTTI